MGARVAHDVQAGDQSTNAVVKAENRLEPERDCFAILAAYARLSRSLTSSVVRPAPVSLLDEWDWRGNDEASESRDSPMTGAGPRD